MHKPDVLDPPASTAETMVDEHADCDTCCRLRAFPNVSVVETCSGAGCSSRSSSLACSISRFPVSPSCRCPTGMVTNDAVFVPRFLRLGMLHHSGLPPAPIRWVLVRDPTGVRDPQAFLCTDLDATPVEILGWFVSRWSIETTFQESRAHLGVETQRQWSENTPIDRSACFKGFMWSTL